MTITTPQGPIVVQDSIRTLSAYRYMLFNQSWAKEAAIGADMYAQDGHLARLGILLTPDTLQGARIEYSHIIMGFRNLTSKVPASHLAETLAPLVVSIGEKGYNDASEAGLAAVANAVLASGLTQEQLVDAVDQSKKNFRQS